ncbi:MAG: Rieske 2Fe-2S domain-containing protein, partial [Gammaproteobacteria bacterium]|nr:Rieske 2Fe-2S domain-containing protein [Gammaproteobacteria bacterium]
MTPAYIKAANIQAIDPGQMLKIKVGDKNILLANIDGNIYAIDDQCSHEDASLYNGALKG